jgi:hypothetical protein
LSGQSLAGVVVFGRHVELLDQVERKLVDRFVVAHHVVRKRPDLLVVSFRQGLFSGRDVDYAGGVGDMSNLRVGELAALRQHGALNSVIATTAAPNRTNMMCLLWMI